LPLEEIRSGVKMKKALTIVAMILLGVLVALGSFWGGMRTESNRADRARANFMNARGQANGEFFSPEGQIPSGEAPSGFMGGGTLGEVKSVDGNVVTLSTAQDVTTVQLTGETRIGKTVMAVAAELEPGMRVRVTGERDTNGDITADQVTILSDEFPGDVLPIPADPSQAGTEP
jgi:hypothetical protein